MSIKRHIESVLNKQTHHIGGIKITHQQILELNQTLIGLQESLGETLEEKAEAETTGPDQLTQNFNAQLVKSIEQTLASLGEPVKNTFFQQLEFDFNFPKNAIPENLDLFTRLLHNAFGIGVRRVEVNILKDLQKKLNVDLELVEYEWPVSKWVVADFSFKNLVWKAKKLITAKQLNQ
jgi:hypothetical protein